MKKILTAILLFAAIFEGSSQVKKPMNDPGYDYKMLHFGFTVGLNTMDFGFTRPHGTNLFADVSRPNPGFQVSIVSDLRINDHFCLRFLPGITFGSRSVYFYNDSILDSVMELESNFLDFPLLIKYKSKRVNNYRPYLVAGINPRYDMAARKAYEEDSGIFIRLKPFDFYFELGFGIDYFLQYFKFSTELKISAGMRDVLIGTPAAGFPQYANSIDRLNSFLVMLCFHFE